MINIAVATRNALARIWYIRLNLRPPIATSYSLQHAMSKELDQRKSPNLQFAVQNHDKQGQPRAELFNPTLDPRDMQVAACQDSTPT